MNTATLSYSETSKATRLARALLDEGYDSTYVIRALTEKGFSHEEAIDLLKAGHIEVCNDKIKQSRVIAIVMGILWGIVGVLWFFTKDNPPAHEVAIPGYTRTTSSNDFILPFKFVWIAAAVFVVALGRVIYYSRKKKRFENLQ